MNEVQQKVGIKDSTATRDSNMELLRIIAMLLVLVVHSCFKSLGYPTTEEAIANPTYIFLRYLVESASVICVNVFILLSGWYGIKARINSFSKFVFQVLFFSIGFFAYHFISNLPTVSFDGIGSILALKGSDYWFVKSYIGLYILAPVLNMYVEKASKEQLRNTLIAFYTFQSIYGWYTSGASWFELGYSTISFLGLYLLGRYVRLYQPSYSKYSYKTDLFLYAIIVFATAISGFTLTYSGHEMDNIIYEYSSPFIILSSLFFLLAFSKMHIQSKMINWIAASAFAAYLFHTNRFFFDTIYCKKIAVWSNNMDTILFALYTLTWIILVFIVAILIDKIRIICWNRIEKILYL